MDHEGAKAPAAQAGTKGTEREGREDPASARRVAARAAAWLLVVGVTAWLLGLTLREMSGERLGRIRFGLPQNEVNLRPLVNKLETLHDLKSPIPAVRRHAQVYLLVDVLGNVVAFAPFGASLAAATLLSSRSRLHGRFRRWWLKVSLAGLALSLFIELGQLAIPGRVTDVDDVILNTIGTAAGALLVAGLLRLTKKT